MQTLTPQSAATKEGQRLYEIFQRGKYLSLKHDSYFQVYERVLGRFVGQNITFVEVGVLNGGSLFMWREYFGPQARIIGIDLNPQAKRWEEHGFEIYIGSQSDPAFWESFYQAVGKVDVVLDDGGHTNRQQLITTFHALKHIKDGGVLLVEDVHASYLREFGNPSRYSFVNFCKFVVDSVNRRCGELQRTVNDYWKRVYSIEFYESIVVMNIDSSRCFVSVPVRNSGESFNAQDFRNEGINKIISDVDRALSFLNRVILLKSIKKRLIRAMYFLANRFNDTRLAAYFR